MPLKISSILNRLIQRRLLLWMISLLVILVLLGALGIIFWEVRIKVSYPVEMRFNPSGEESLKNRSDRGELIFLASLPRRRFHSIDRGKKVRITLAAGIEGDGVVRKVEKGPDSIKLTIAIERIDGGKAARGRLESLTDQQVKFKGTITLRDLRLIAAFSRRSPR
jgi:hypothetical protein